MAQYYSERRFRCGLYRHGPHYGHFGMYIGLCVCLQQRQSPHEGPGGSRADHGQGHSPEAAPPQKITDPGRLQGLPFLFAKHIVGEAFRLLAVKYCKYIKGRKPVPCRRICDNCFLALVSGVAIREFIFDNLDYHKKTLYNTITIVRTGQGQGTVLCPNRQRHRTGHCLRLPFYSIR